MTTRTLVLPSVTDSGNALRFLRLPQVIEQVGMSRSQIYFLMKKGEFPRPLKVASKTAVWPAQTIFAWQQQRIAEAEAEAEAETETEAQCQT